ncbi:MAG: exodeoxyribonuclease VII large subunit [Fretibacterium sp.]|nr:exodeoxyribonuclease VII large subunit [Fretibacterium sp.]
MPRRTRSEMTVDDLNFYIQGLLTADLMLKSLVITGEIAEFRQHTSGHCYFTLLGTETRVSCALFRHDAELLPQWPRDGDSVLVEGHVGSYPARGVYQLYARRILPVGEGAAGRARQELRKRLEAEGLFHPALKRPLPPCPVRAAVITSATGAALRDVLRIASRRYPLCEILVIPALVQGIDAPESIVHAFIQAGKTDHLDCVLLVRGGGSREDLNPFDDERVVRAVRSCPWPVVSGVGHEIDETLCDLAADVRASTPSAAAELVFPDRQVLLAQLEALKEALRGSMERRLDALQNRLGAALEGLSRSMKKRVSDARGQLAVRAASLNALSPLAALSRGFVTAETDGQRLLSVKGLHAGDGLAVNFSDGRADCLVQTIKKKRKRIK